MLGQLSPDPNSLQIPLTWKKPRKIFVNSMSDLFHDAVSNRFVEQVWEVMAATPHHHYQILTKRPNRMRDMLIAWGRKPLANVWLGASIENSKVADRVDALRDVPSVIRFISFEPLIGAVGNIDLPNIQWAIVGGEILAFLPGIR